MSPSATSGRRIQRRLLFGARIVALSAARLPPSPVLASASKRATSRIAERANEPSPPAAPLSARREFVARRATGWFLTAAHSVRLWRAQGGGRRPRPSFFPPRCRHSIKPTPPPVWLPPRPEGKAPRGLRQTQTRP